MIGFDLNFSSDGQHIAYFANSGEAEEVWKPKQTARHRSN